MSLEQWFQSQYIIKHQATAPQILQLLSIVDRELADAGIAAVSADGRFTHAYNAALTLCRIALLAAGYRVSKGGGARFTRNLVVSLTLGDSHKDIQLFLSACTKKRGQEMYTHAGVVDIPAGRLHQRECTFLAPLLRTRRKKNMDFFM